VGSNLVSITSPAQVVAKYCNEYVCACVCLSDHEVSLEPHAQSVPSSSVHVAYGRGSVLLRRRCDMLCISEFVDDIMFFFYNGRTAVSILLRRTEFSLIFTHLPQSRTEFNFKLLNSIILTGYNARLHRFPIGNLLWHFNTTTSIGEAVKAFRTEFCLSGGLHAAHQKGSYLHFRQRPMSNIAY